MKKSKQVPATLIATVAAIVATGCSSGPVEVRRCVDASGRVLPDSMCTGPGAAGTYVGGTGTGTGSGYRSGYYSSPHWVYGGSMRGGTVSGYHSTPSEGATVNDSSGHTISRGGFGGSGGGGS